jgi:hypothetical protein
LTQQGGITGDHHNHPGQEKSGLSKHCKRFSQVDKGDEVEYNGFNLNAREKCDVFSLA